MRTRRYSRAPQLCILIASITGVARAEGPAGGAADLPFRIEATEDVAARFPGAPKLQSFAWATWAGKWIFIGGRTTGYHGVGESAADFPRAGSNEKIWVVDPESTPAKTYSFPLSKLPETLAPLRDQWASSNILFFQDGPTLYLAGGYGADHLGKLVTFPILSSIDLPSLIEGVVKGEDTFSAKTAWTKDALVQSAGGDLVKLDDGLFYLAGGHIFTGSYRDFEGASERNTAAASQQYLGEIRKLKVTRPGARRLAVELVARYAAPEFARRDMNAGLIILPDGRSLGAAVYGGVFTKAQLNFSKPIYWDTKAQPVEDSFEQKMSSYSCAKVQFFDPDVKAMYTTFFGGISRFTWDDVRSTFLEAPLLGDKSKRVYFDGMPWIDQISTLIKTEHGSGEKVQPARLGGFVGSNAAFLPVAGLKRIREDADVFDLTALRGTRTLIGYIYGGIRAFPREFPYLETSPSYSAGNVPTKPNDLVLAVYLTVPPAKP